MTIIKDVVSDRLDENKDKQVKLQSIALTRTIDSLNTIKQQENSKLIIETFIKSIKTTGIKLDANSSDLRKFITDSVKRLEQKNYYGNEGEVILNGVTQKKYQNDSLLLDLTFRTNHRSCSHVRIEIVPILEKSNSALFGYPINTIIKDVTIEYGTLPFKTIAIPKAANTKNLILPVRFSWKNETGKEFSRVDYYYYSPEDNEYGTIEDAYTKPYRNIVLSKYPDFK